MPKLYQTKNNYQIDMDEQEGEIKLFIVDEFGTPIINGEILRILANGELYIMKGVDRIAAQKAGIKLNEVSGRIVHRFED
ncbi:hypothetical protein [Bacteroides sp.]|uniref:hypothetical protein n=1 Tax=Bacteroides sp. TaxID=29523 RepID=UPI00263270EF|nr:hypothetical protein [Bacteroides sp.]MDD3040890.1 hypothetical protein [Bacteroides sp.]